jgi:single-stranded-DNA-specific exonuclease
MSIGIECLLSDDPVTARKLAAELDSLNRQRREIEGDMKQQALAMLEALHLDEKTIPAGLCLFESGWHQGVVGIVASRVKEIYHRPVIVFAAEDEETLKGSARSIPGVHIRDLLDAIATSHPELIQKFGGHAMAAGLSLPAENFNTFSRLFDLHVRQLVDESQLKGQLESDGSLGLTELTLEHASLVREAGPWGQAFPEPLFDNRFIVQGQRVVGENHLKLLLSPERDPSARIDAIAFNQAEEHVLENGQEIQAAYRLDINEYMGRTKLQLIVQAIVA